MASDEPKETNPTCMSAMRFLRHKSVFECMRAGRERGTDRKTTKIKVSGKTFGCQATGLLATVVLSYEEWYDLTSPIWFQDGVGVGLKGAMGGEDAEMSPPVLICQAW